MVSVPENRILRAATYVPKGGVGKTTTTAHVGVAAAQEHDLDVVLLDLAGTQNDLSTHFGITEDIEDIDAPISAVFGDNWNVIVDGIDDILDRMLFETVEGVDIIPADSGLGGADNNLASVPVEERFRKLDSFITDQLAPRYDLVLLDLPGAENNITLNGLFAASNVIAPLKPGAFESEQLDSLNDDLVRICEEHPDVNPQLVMVVPTMYDKRTNLGQEFVDELSAEYPGKAAPARVAKSQAVSNWQESGKTLFAVPDDERSGTGERVVSAYRENTTELLSTLSST
jgi:chromosome partitioning protein